jgi:Leucine-rich repeat (LRR) protein
VKKLEKTDRSNGNKALRKDNSRSSGADADARVRKAFASLSRNLDLSGMKLTKLPDKLRDAKQIKTLDISSNHLSTLPDWLGELDKLEELNVADNRFSSIPNSLHKVGAA